MSLSSDEIIKREIIETLGFEYKDIKLRIFPESSMEDQKLFFDGGLTFVFKNTSYGSCDACWYIEEEWIDSFNNKKVNKKPIIALEGTDALNRNSAGNALYQRFHHVLGAVKNGIVGVYYLKKGSKQIQPDLYGMAYYASKVENGDYLIIDDLQVVKKLLESYRDKDSFNSFIKNYLEEMYTIFNKKFQTSYKGDWKEFAKNRSTIIKNDYVIKYAGRSRRNFTDSSQRAGHIAVGEMFLTKYYFYDKKVYYLFPKMTKEDLDLLDKNKKTDKEWFLLRNEPNVFIKTIDDVEGISKEIKKKLLDIKDEPLKGDALKIYMSCSKEIFSKLESGEYKINE